MKQGALDRSRFETIEAYVLDNMPALDRARFEGEMVDDADLREEVLLQTENTLAIEWGGGSRLLRRIGAEQASARPDRISERADRGRYLKYAAAIAIILSGSLWILTRPSTNERLYAEHFIADPGLPTPMSATNDFAFHDAMVAYKLGDHAEARSKWAALLQAQPANDTLRYYIASAALGMEDEVAAIPLFDGLTKDTASIFRDKAKWYLFLAYIKNDQVAKAKAISFDGDVPYGEQVRAIKAELK